ncbi:MAG: T9SS type A sorting domain-containing protein, partial [Bacteroidales bacterium]|nr:T9SS type A sorting domain-containing protein [Bacteroidales bacterium]
MCKGENTSEYHLPDEPLVESYKWKLMPSIAGMLNEEGNSTQVAWDPDFSGYAYLYAETASGSCKGPDSDTLAIQLVGPVAEPEICIVGMDEASGYYQVIWNRLPGLEILTYHIHRESNQAGVFLHLAEIPADQFSVWIDSSSAPESLSHAYYITYTDTCGNESDPGIIHRTIHLSANLGSSGENNLSWTPYEGFAFLTYEIWRGTSKDSMELLRDVPSSVTSFSDQDPPTQKLYYQIVVSRDGACQPMQKATIDYSVSKSNVLEVNTIGIENLDMNRFKVFPNPAKEYLIVALDQGLNMDGKIRIYDVYGKLVETYPIESPHNVINTNHWSSGMYFIELYSDERTGYARLIVE